MNSRDPRRYPPLEGGLFGWLAVLGCFLWELIFSAVEKAFGIILLVLDREFPATPIDRVVGVGSLAMCLNDMLGLVSAAVIRRGVTPRVVIFVAALFLVGGALGSAYAATVPVFYLTFGLCIGIGSGFAFTASYIAVAQYFQRRLTVATGIVYFGGGIGGIVAPPVLERLAEAYGRRGMLFGLTGFLGVTFVVAGVTRPIEHNYPDGGVEADGDLKSQNDNRSVDYSGFEDSSTTKAKPTDRPTEAVSDSSSSETDHLNNSNVPTYCKESEVKDQTAEPSPLPPYNDCSVLGLNLFLLRDPVFLLYLLTQMIAVPCGYWSPIYLPGLAVEKGVTEIQAALLNSIAFGTQVSVILLVGLILNFSAVKRHWRLIGVVHLFLLGVVDLIAAFLATYWQFAIYAVAHGSLFSISLVLRAPLLIDLMERRHLESLLGILNFFKGVGYLAIPGVGGLLLKTYGRYDAAYFFNAAANSTAASALAAACWLRRRREKALAAASATAAKVKTDSE